MQRPPPIRRTARRTALLGQHKPRRPHLAAGAGPPPWPPPSAVRRGRSRRGHHTAPASGVGASLWSIFVRDPTSPHPLGVRPDPRGGALKRTTAATTIPTTIRTITAGATAVALLLSYRRKQTANGGATAAGRPRRSPRHRHRPFHQLRRAFNKQRPAAGELSSQACSCLRAGAQLSNLNMLVRLICATTTVASSRRPLVTTPDRAATGRRPRQVQRPRLGFE